MRPAVEVPTFKQEPPVSSCVCQVIGDGRFVETRTYDVVFYSAAHRCTAALLASQVCGEICSSMVNLASAHLVSCHSKDVLPATWRSVVH